MSEKEMRAFPPVHDPKTHEAGMSLRDYFAAKAMQGIIGLGVYSGGADMFSCVAKDSYELADEMMKAREK